MDNGLGQPLIAIRVKDGIFVGNVTAALDEDFVVMNKVTHIVNCCGTEVKDLYEDIGIEYLTFGWRDSAGTTTGGMNGSGSLMFDQADRNIEQVVRFVDQGVDSGNCVLIHSYFGANRSCALLAAYLIVKYGWKLDNTLAFISLAHSDMAIKPHFMRQLKQFARRHDVALDIFQKDADDSRLALDNDQWMLRNTFLNGLGTDTLSRNELYQEAVSNTVNVLEPNFKTSTKRRRRILFVDTKQGTSVGSQVSQPLATPRHQDPHQMMNEQQGVGTPSRNSILARRASPNNRRLESPSDVNPRGRLMLTPRRSVENGHTANGSGAQPGGTMSDPEEPEDIEPQQRPLAADSQTHQPFQRQQQPSGARGSLQPQQQQRPGQAGGQGSIRNPFALSYTGGGQVRKGSPLPLQRQARGTRQTQEDADRGANSSYGGGGAGSPYNRNPIAPSSTSQLRTSDGQPQPRTNSPIKRQVGRAESPRPNPTAGGTSRTDSFSSRMGTSGTSGGGQPRAGSPMGSRLVFQSHPSIPNANSTIVSNTQLRSTASVRPYTASPMVNSSSGNAGGGRADSPMGRRTTVGNPIQSSRGGTTTIENTLGRNSPRSNVSSGATGGNRLSSPQVQGNRAGSPQVRAGSPMSRSGGAGGPSGTAGTRPMSLADQYLSGGGGSQARPRETTASLLRRQQNLSAHRY